MIILTTVSTLFDESYFFRQLSFLAYFLWAIFSRSIRPLSHEYLTLSLKPTPPFSLRNHHHLQRIQLSSYMWQYLSLLHLFYTGLEEGKEEEKEEIVSYTKLMFGTELYANELIPKVTNRM